MSPRSWKIHMVQLEFCIVSYWKSVTKEQSLLTHISHLSHWTALWLFKTSPLHRPHSALQSLQYQVSFSDPNSFSLRFAHDTWKHLLHSWHLTTLSVALQYFLHWRLWDLGPGFISISPARMISTSRFVPLEGLKLRKPSELLRFPSFLE